MISIIVPIYNAELYLFDCLESIASQSYPDFEVLCINDGSTDNSELICRKFSETDQRFKFFSQQNAGVSAARNMALSYAVGDYICFVDSDDVISPDHLKTFMELISGYDIAVTGYTRNRASLGTAASKKLQFGAKQYIKNIINEAIIHPQIVCMLYRRDVIKNANLRFTVGCVRNEDAEFFTKYLANVETVNSSDYVGYYYRENETSAVHKFNEKSLTFIEADRRISQYLVERDIYPISNYIMSSSVQYFVYKCARQQNKEIYSLVHERYDVRKEMAKMIRFPRISRRLVALMYLVLGEKLFYRLVGFGS